MLRLGLITICIFSLWGTTLGEDFSRASSPRQFTFPRDHGSHPDFKTEWWYLTGWLAPAADSPELAQTAQPTWGYQLTFFRTAFGRSEATSPDRLSPLAVGDLIIFHGALSDLSLASAVHDQGLSRQAAHWAEADTAGLDVYYFANYLRQNPEGTWQAGFNVGGRRLELELTPTTAPLLHGHSPGLSRKGPQKGQASYYYSQTRLLTQAKLRDPATNQIQHLSGQSWFDHEFGSQQLAAGLVGWDWFSVGLDDGSDLMVYLLRGADGSPQEASSGTLVRPDGTITHLKREDFSLRILDTWKSPHTGATYPSAWDLSLAAHSLHLRIEPHLADQEVDARPTTSIAYWEGLCSFVGRHGEKPVKGHGYVELVGYLEAITDRF
jgi:predicted secreted hydrolase